MSSPQSWADALLGGSVASAQQLCGAVRSMLLPLAHRLKPVPGNASWNRASSVCLDGEAVCVTCVGVCLCVSQCPAVCTSSGQGKPRAGGWPTASLTWMFCRHTGPPCPLSPVAGIALLPGAVFDSISFVQEGSRTHLIETPGGPAVPAR